MRVKTWLFATIVVLSNSVGNLFLDIGVGKTVVAGAGFSLSPMLLLGVALLIFWTLARMALLSWADLSFVLPVTSVGYAFTALLGHWFLNEPIGDKRWLGIALITAGAFFVGRSTPSSTPAPASLENRL